MHQSVPFSTGNSSGGRPGDDSAGRSGSSGEGNRCGVGGQGGGLGMSGSSAVGSDSGRQAYWNRQRRERNLSAQLVFATKPPENTEEIVQPDPSISGENTFFAACFRWERGLGGWKGCGGFFNTCFLVD